jgi:hypothetical protein
VLLMLGALAAGFATTRLWPSTALEPALPTPEPPPPEAPRPAPPAPLADDQAVETCTTALWHARGRGQFEVRVEDEGGGHRVVARSLSFAVPAGTVVSETGAAGSAHRRLLLHLVAAGWELESPGDGTWYERRLTRPLRREGEVDRALVTSRPAGGEAEFVALALDEYGNAHVMARSPRFSPRQGRPLEETEPALAAHGTLLETLEAHGWQVSGRLDDWYGATLARRRR